MNEMDILVMNIRGNILRIDELLSDEKSLSKLNSNCEWYSVNRDNSELRQRMHLLRRDTKRLEKLIMRG